MEETLGSILWNGVGVLIVGYIAIKVIPALTEAVSGARDFFALKRAEIRMVADAADLDIDKYREKDKVFEQEHKNYAQKLKDLKKQAKEIKEVKKELEKGAK